MKKAIKLICSSSNSDLPSSHEIFSEIFSPVAVGICRHSCSVSAWKRHLRHLRQRRRTTLELPHKSAQEHQEPPKQRTNKRGFYRNVIDTDYRSTIRLVFIQGAFLYGFRCVLFLRL